MLLFKLWNHMASYQADATYDRQYIDRIGEKDEEITYVQAVDE